MPTDPARRQRVHPLRSLLFQCGFVVSIGMILVVMAIEWRNHAVLRDAARQDVSASAFAVGHLLARQLGGAVQFGNDAAVAEIVRDAIEVTGKSGVGAQVTDATGQVLFRSEVAAIETIYGFDSGLVQAALRTGDVRVSPDNLTFAHPIYFVDTANVAGVLLSQWRVDQGGIGGYRKQSAILVISLTLIMLFLTVLFLRWRVFIPLYQLGNDLAGKDEIGAIALRFETLQNDLQQARNLHEELVSKAQSASAEQDDIVEVLGRAFRGLAAGELGVEIDEVVPPAYAEIRSDFNATVEALRGTISCVMHNSNSIRIETSEITAAADDLSRRTEKQAATLEETAAALDQLTASVKSASKGANDASKMSAEARKNAEDGGTVARKAVAAMDGIKTSSEKISKITNIIDDIAFQTNLLALNAGVEAARAGEAGRGFAVVATEVRALSQRSSDAAREINVLITTSTEQVQQGVELVDKTGTSLASIVTSVTDISSRVSTIASSAREQSTALAEINIAVNDLDHVTQQNAAMFAQTTAASHALIGEADALSNAVARFRMVEDEVVGEHRATINHTEFRSRPTSNAIKSLRAASRGNAALKMSPEPEPDGWEEF